MKWKEQLSKQVHKKKRNEQKMYEFESILCKYWNFIYDNNL